MAQVAVGAKRVDRFEHGVEVVRRLAHTHEDDAPHRSRAWAYRSCERDLRHDLGARELRRVDPRGGDHGRRFHLGRVVALVRAPDQLIGEPDGRPEARPKLSEEDVKKVIVELVRPLHAEVMAMKDSSQVSCSARWRSAIMPLFHLPGRGGDSHGVRQ